MPTTPAMLPFHVVDVFADRPFAGNALAVVLEADDLPAEALQAIAREFNLTETAFPMEPSDEERASGADYRLRIFTPYAELPFAGHPSVGAAWVLASLGKLTPGVVRQACGAGVLPLTVEPGPGAVELTGGAPRVGGELEVADALAACHLDGSVPIARPPRTAGTGIDWAFLLVGDDAAIARSVPDRAVLARLVDQGAEAGIMVASWDAESRTAHARGFAGDIGSFEDPATGSAVLGLGAYLVAEGLLPGDGETVYAVRQGEEMGRPSRLDCTVVARGGAAVECRVAGHVVPVSTGSIRRP